jgi:hypothetical protein
MCLCEVLCRTFPSKLHRGWQLTSSMHPSPLPPNLHYLIWRSCLFETPRLIPSHRHGRYSI